MAETASAVRSTPAVVTKTPKGRLPTGRYRSGRQVAGSSEVVRRDPCEEFRQVNQRLQRLESGGNTPPPLRRRPMLVANISVNGGAATIRDVSLHVGWPSPYPSKNRPCAVAAFRWRGCVPEGVILDVVEDVTFDDTTSIGDDTTRQPQAGRGRFQRLSDGQHHALSFPIEPLATGAFVLVGKDKPLMTCEDDEVRQFKDENALAMLDVDLVSLFQKACSVDTIDSELEEFCAERGYRRTTDK